jgi:methionyl-tRNA formyltransferase
LKILFMGTPEAALPALHALYGYADELVVCTQPDRAQGRSQAPVPPPVKEAATRLGLAVLQPANRDAVFDAVAAAVPFDVGVVVAYGMILDHATLTLPDTGFLNVHFSLLPRWRGAAPVERAILAGDENTGVTIMAMDEGLDTGPIVALQASPIGEGENAGDLTARLAVDGAELLVATLPRWVEGAIRPEPQDDGLSTYAARLTTDEAKLDFSMPAVTLARQIRAFNPRPGAWALHDDRLKIWSATPAATGTLAPGQLHIEGAAVMVGTGEQDLLLRVVQPAGRRSMPAEEWARGLRDDARDVLR